MLLLTDTAAKHAPYLEAINIYTGFSALLDDRWYERHDARKDGLALVVSLRPSPELLEVVLAHDVRWNGVLPSNCTNLACNKMCYPFVCAPHCGFETCLSREKICAASATVMIAHHVL